MDKKNKNSSFSDFISKDNITFGMIVPNKNEELCYNAILCLEQNRILKSPPKCIIFLNDFQIIFYLYFIYLYL